jgi:hypothetical protein
LCRVRDLGVTLLAVTCVEPELQAPSWPASMIATDNQAAQNERHTNG